MAVRSRFRSFAVRPATLAIGFAGLAVLIEELRGMRVHRGRLVVDDGCILMRRSTPALMLLVPPVRFPHNPRLSPS